MYNISYNINNGIQYLTNQQLIIFMIKFKKIFYKINKIYLIN